MKTKILYIFLCVFMLLQVTFAAESPSYWAQEEVSEAIELGIVPEKFQTDYSEPITREDFCELMLYVLNGLSDDIISSSSIDISTVHYDDTDNIAVKQATQLGIVSGRGNNQFDPKGNITRQETAIMLHNTADISIRNTELEKYFDDDFLMICRVMDYPYQFADYAQIAYWASDSVQYCYQNKIMLGVGHDNFEPLGQYSREQAYMTALRLYKIFKGDGVKDEKYERRYRICDNKQIVVNNGIYSLIDTSGNVLVDDIKKNIDAFDREGGYIYDCYGEYVIVIYPFDKEQWLTSEGYPEFTAALYKTDGQLLHTITPEFRFTSDGMVLIYNSGTILFNEDKVLLMEYDLFEIEQESIIFVKKNTPTFI